LNDFALNLIVFGVLLLASGGIFMMVRRYQAGNAQKITQMAAENGWVVEHIHERLVWGLRLSSAKWRFEALSRSSGGETAPGSSDVEISTRWHADSPGSAFLIGLRSTQANLGTAGDMLTQMVMQMALGTDADGLNEIQVGNESFRQKYMVWAKYPDDAEKLLTPDLESALLGWKSAPLLIQRTSKGLNLELRGVRLGRADEIQAFIHIGEILIET
jgi:hypothetical protein